MRKQKGFSLIELLIVVAIILIIAAIAIPNLLRSKIAANEASAVGSTRTLITTEITWMTSKGSYAALTTLSTNNYIDPVLGGGKKSGYQFTGPADLATTLFILAAPEVAGTTGVRYFCGTEDGVVHQSTATFADHDACVANTTPI